MKLILLSDIHATLKTPVARKDNIIEALASKLEYVWMRAKMLQAHIIQAGDLCNRPREWDVCFWLAHFLSQHKIPIHTIRGQHDLYMRSPESSGTVPVLAELEYVHLIEREFDIVRHYFPGAWMGRILITGVPYGSNPGPNPRREENIIRIMVIHAPIAEEALYPNQEYMDARAFGEKYNGYDVILCGDIHRRFCIQATENTTIVNTGPMLRLDASSYNFSHMPHFYVYDTNTKELCSEIIPHRPAKEVLSRGHLDSIEETKVLMAGFVEKIKETLVQETPGVDVRSKLVRALKQMSADMPKSTRELILEVVNATTHSD